MTGKDEVGMAVATLGLEAHLGQNICLTVSELSSGGSIRNPLPFQFLELL